MTRLAALLAALLLAACVAAPQLLQLPPAPQAVSRASTKSVGAQVGAINNYCAVAAHNACPDITIRCEAFRPAYVKSCMLKYNVPPDYIAALTR